MFENKTKNVIRKVIGSYKSTTLFNQLGKPIVVVKDLSNFFLMCDGQ